MSKRASLILSIISVLGFGIVGGKLLSAFWDSDCTTIIYILCVSLSITMALKFIGLMVTWKPAPLCSEKVSSEKCPKILCFHHILAILYLAILYLAFNCLSIDYSMTRICKEKFYGERENRGAFIISQNVLNLLVSIILLIPCCANPNEIIRGIITIRLISRTMEINLSFFYDIISKQDNKKSNLNREERIKLALFSFIEEIILFFALYLAIARNVDCENITKKAFSFLIGVYVGTDFGLLCVSTYQKICTFIIITLSLITYVSNPPTTSDS